MDFKYSSGSQLTLVLKGVKTLATTEILPCDFAVNVFGSSQYLWTRAARKYTRRSSVSRKFVMKNFMSQKSKQPPILNFSKPLIVVRKRDHGKHTLNGPLNFIGIYNSV